MGGGNKPKVYDYLLSMQSGIAHGPIDSINRIRIKDKAVHVGRIERRTNICVDMPDLFGGDDKEGGPQGVIEVYMGTDEQRASPQLADRFGRTPANCPGFRGLAHMFMRGRGRQPGFKWTTNNYYLPDFDVSITDIPWGLDDAAGTDLAVIMPMDCEQGEQGGISEEEGGIVLGQSVEQLLEPPPVMANRVGPSYSGISFARTDYWAEHRIAVPDEDGSFCDDGSERDGYLQFLYPDGNDGRDDGLPTFGDVDGGRVQLSADLTLQFHSNFGFAGIRYGLAQIWVSFYEEETQSLLAVPTGVALGSVPDGGSGIVLAYSTNGRAWFPNNWSTQLELADVEWLDREKIFVAVSEDGHFLQSEDGREWRADRTWTTATNANDFSALVYSKDLGTLLAFAREGNEVAVSGDGVTWAAHPMPGDHPWAAAVWSPETLQFVAVAEDGAIATSPDGEVWAIQAAPVAAWKGVAWSPEFGLFAAVGSEPNAMCIATSPDGEVWTACEGPSDADWRAVAWHPQSSRFVAAGFPLSPGAEASMVSEDGIYWEPITQIAAEGVNDILWSAHNDTMVASGPGGLYYSANGRTWSRAAQAVESPGRRLAGARDMRRGVLGKRVLPPYGDVENDVAQGEPSATAQVGLTVPRGARFVRVWMGGLLVMVLFAWATVTSRRVKLNWTPGSGASPTVVTDDSLGVQPDANPVHIIYELMTNPEWGKGEDPSLIDLPSHVAAAQTLHDEQFGLSYQWVKSGEVEAQIQDVIDHIKAVYFQHPATAKWTIKLLRPDYDPASLKVINPDNAIIENASRRSWGELVNEIVVSYTNPDSEDEETVTSHNLATYVTEGGYVSEGRNYHAIRNACLGQRVADRDVIEAGYPLWSGTAHLLRDEWEITPGAVYRLDWPEDDVYGMVVRVMNVDYGKPGARTIKATLTEDIFGVVGLDATTGQRPLWEDPWNSAPSALTDSFALTPPLPEVLRAGVPVEDVEDTLPGSRAMLIGAHESANVLEISAHGQQVQPNGDTLWVEKLSMPPTPIAVLDEPWADEPVTHLPRNLIDRLGFGSLVPGSRLLITPKDFVNSYERPIDRHSEIVLLRAFDREEQEWIIDRGLYDTVPRQWGVGARIWALPGAESVDPTVFGPGSTPVAYKLSPRMSRGELPLSSITDTDYFAIQREERPFRPANCQIDSHGFDPAIYESEPFPDDVTATWADRNRWFEDAEIVKWEDPGAAPEDGQTTTLRIVEDPTADPLVVLAEFTGITGSSYTISSLSFGAMQGGWVQFISVRDGLESLQSAARYVYIGYVGWDFTWSGKWGL